MTAKQARRAAKILRDLADSLPSFGFSHPNDDFKAECHTLARALEDFALEGYAEKITAAEESLGLYLNNFKVECSGGF